MRGGVVVAGIVFMVLALFGWMLVIFNPLIGAILCIMSPLLFIIGLILFIVGLVISPPQQQVIVVAQQAPMGSTTASCPVCGRPLTYYRQNGRWYCHYCRAYRS